MRLYALTELHDPEAIELFITEEDARRALEDCLRDEPQWRGLLEVKEVELDHEHHVAQLATSTRTGSSVGTGRRPETGFIDSPQRL
jgi:hypothetical protein